MSNRNDRVKRMDDNWIISLRIRHQSRYERAAEV